MNNKEIIQIINNLEAGTAFLEIDIDGDVSLEYGPAGERIRLPYREEVMTAWDDGDITPLVLMIIEYMEDL